MKEKMLEIVNIAIKEIDDPSDIGGIAWTCLYQLATIMKKGNWSDRETARAYWRGLSKKIDENMYLAERDMYEEATDGKS